MPRCGVRFRAMADIVVVDGWDDQCAIDQVKTQAEREALKKIREMQTHPTKRTTGDRTVAIDGVLVHFQLERAGCGRQYVSITIEVRKTDGH